MNFVLNFKAKHKTSSRFNPRYFEWNSNLGIGEYFSFPNMIFSKDFSMNISKGNDKENKKDSVILHNYSQQEVDLNNNNDGALKFISCQYLMQLYS
jgi:hypothetical protein